MRGSRHSLSWLRPGLDIKRWLLAGGVAVFLISLGLGYALKGFYAQGLRLPPVFRYLTLNFLDDVSFGGQAHSLKWLQALIFALAGFGLLVLSMVKLSESMLVPFIRPDTDLQSIYRRHRTTRNGARVVALGGGASYSSLLHGLKTYTSNISAVVMPPGAAAHALPDDYRLSMIALAETQPLMADLLRHRFSSGSLDRFAMGDLVISALSNITGSVEHALRVSGRVLAFAGEILTATTADSEANPDVLVRIAAANIITIGPGDLDQTVIPLLRVEGIATALRSVRGSVVYIYDADPTDVAAMDMHLALIESVIGQGSLDCVLTNPSSGPRSWRDRNSLRDTRIVAADLGAKNEPAEQSARKLGEAVLRTLGLTAG